MFWSEKKKFLDYSLTSLPWLHGHPHLTNVILVNSFPLYGVLKITHCPQGAKKVSFYSLPFRQAVSSMQGWR